MLLPMDRSCPPYRERRSRRAPVLLMGLACLVASASALGAGRGAGKSLSLNGDMIFAAVHSEAFDLDRAVTVEAWIRPERFGPEGAAIVDKGKDAFVLDTHRRGALRMIVAGSEVKAKAELPTGRWSHVAGVFSARDRTARLYVGGKEIAKRGGLSVGKLGRNGKMLLVGAGSGREPRGFRGRMDRVAVYSRALAPDEIAKLAAKSDHRSLDLAGRAGDWDFRDGVRGLFRNKVKGPAMVRSAVRLGPKPYFPTEQYEVRQVEGWRVMVSGKLVEKAELCGQALALLRDHLYRLCFAVPSEAVAKLRKVTIWLEDKDPHHGCAAYHPNINWLREHGLNPEKARCVEIANATNFLSWTRGQPSMVLHELAHAYHDRLPGRYGSDDVRTGYKRAMEAKLYESVLHIGGRKRRAYATTNPMEYFAENTEAFFGTNDFYPFVRAELKEHDPETYKLLERLWGVKKK